MLNWHNLLICLKRMIDCEFFRFAFVGGIATLIHYSIYLIFVNVCTTNIAYTMGYAISLCVNYFLSARFTFRAKASISNSLGFVLSHIVNYALQILVLNIMLSFGVHSKWAPLPVYLVCVPINFLMVRFVFKKI